MILINKSNKEFRVRGSLKMSTVHNPNFAGGQCAQHQSIEVRGSSIVQCPPAAQGGGGAAHMPASMAAQGLARRRCRRRWRRHNRATGRAFAAHGRVSGVVGRLRRPKCGSVKCVTLQCCQCCPRAAQCRGHGAGGYDGSTGAHCYILVLNLFWVALILFYGC